MTEPCDLDAVRARQLIGTRELAPTELLASCIARIEAVDGAVNAMVTRSFERATVEARAADDAVARGAELDALHGLPIAIKDLQDTEGIVTTYGSEFYADRVPMADHGIVARVRTAGAIVIGKTNIPEMSIGANTVNRLFGATGNPFDVDLSCGGSSGGSAVALATGMAPLATGSDHGGSLRIPACYCGVAAHRSSPGVVPNEQRTITQTTYSVQGPMGRTVADTALLLSVIARRDRSSRLDPMAFPLDAAKLAQLDPIDLASLRVGVSADLGGVMVSQTVRRSFAQRVEALAGLVGEVVEVAVDLTPASEVDWQLRADVFATQYHRDIDTYDEGFNPNIRRTYENALASSVLDIARARRLQMELFQSFDQAFDEVDVVICPGVSVPPFPWRDLYPRSVDGEPVANYMAWLALSASLTVVGNPVTVIPAGRDEQGTPFGLQLVGPAFGDRQVLATAAALEGAFSHDDLLARPAVDPRSFTGLRSACAVDGRRVQIDG